MKYTWIIETPIGHLSLLATEKYLLKISFGGIESDATIKQTPIIKKTEQELKEYFNGKRTKFTIPINTIGTEFQKQVWNKLTEIPYGTTISYKELATSVKGKNYSRAVGMANNRNPIPIIIPCHRVVGTKGELVGYRGGVDIKEKLINLEKQLINKRR